MPKTWFFFQLNKNYVKEKKSVCRLFWLFVVWMRPKTWNISDSMKVFVLLPKLIFWRRQFGGCQVPNDQKPKNEEDVIFFSRSICFVQSFYLILKSHTKDNFDWKPLFQKTLMSIRVSISLCFLMSKYLWYTQIVWFDFQRGDEEAEDVASSPVVARTDNNGTDSPITYYGSSCYAKLGVARPEVVLDRGE